jgi:hypothetical protein
MVIQLLGAVHLAPFAHADVEIPLIIEAQPGSEMHPARGGGLGAKEHIDILERPVVQLSRPRAWSRHHQSWLHS